MKQLRRVFHWKNSGVVIPTFVAVGWAAIGVAVSLQSLLNWLFLFADISFALALFWALAFWLTSESLRRRHPNAWNRRRRNSSDLKKARMKYLISKYAVCLLLVMCFAGLILANHSIRIQKELSQMYGVLFPANDPDPADKSVCAVAENEVGLYLGNYSVKTAKFPVTAIQIAGKPAVVMDRNPDGSMVLSINIRSADGKVIAMIDKNHFIVNPNDSLSMKRSDRSTLELMDQFGTEVLNARYLNKKSFRLDAKLYSSGIFVDLSAEPITGVCFAVPNTPLGSSTIMAF